MTWRYSRWTVDHPIPVAAARRAPVGERVRAGDIVASGATLTGVHVVDGARRVGVGPADLDRVLRVRPVADVRRGAILARTGRRFARAAVSPIDGRLVHVSVDGDLLVAPVSDEWVARSTIDGEVTRSDDAVVTVEGECWALPGIAAYGPDAIGALALAAEGPSSPLVPARIDVRLRDRILIGGARVAAEAITRAHACGVAGVVAGAAPAAGLRGVYGDDVGAAGRTVFGDTPTVLCLLGFGSAPLPAEIWGPLAALAGERAAIHTASARLFVIAGPGRVAASPSVPLLALAEDHASVGPAEDPAGPNVLSLHADR